MKKGKVAIFIGYPYVCLNDYYLLYYHWVCHLSSYVRKIFEIFLKGFKKILILFCEFVVEVQGMPMMISEFVFCAYEEY